VKIALCQFGLQDAHSFEDLENHSDKCPGVAGKAARWAAEIILEEEEKRGSGSSK